MRFSYSPCDPQLRRLAQQALPLNLAATSLCKLVEALLQQEDKEGAGHVARGSLRPMVNDRPLIETALRLWKELLNRQ